tara:strand:+ start:21490 stop:22017 length:528 start_codon:yes stop_codon:yes gene_type:complete
MKNTMTKTFQLNHFISQAELEKFIGDLLEELYHTLTLGIDAVFLETEPAEHVQLLQTIRRYSLRACQLYQALHDVSIVDIDALPVSERAFKLDSALPLIELRYPFIETLYTLQSLLDIAYRYVFLETSTCASIEYIHALLATATDLRDAVEALQLADQQSLLTGLASSQPAFIDV